MAFTVENGTGLDNANSYVSVAEADLYFTDRLNTTWTALSTSVKQSNLIKATDYIDQRFGERFIGTKVFEEQALQWPRDNTGSTLLDYDDTLEVGVIPTKLKYACIEYALRANAGSLAPDPEIDVSGVTMVTTKEKVGPIEVEKATASGTSNAATVNILRPYPGADMYLNGLLRAGGTRTFR